MSWLFYARPGRFTPGKETRYPMQRRLGGAQGQIRERQKWLIKQYKLSHTFREIIKVRSGTLSFQSFTDVVGRVSSSDSEGNRSYSRLAKHKFTTISATVWDRVTTQAYIRSKMASPVCFTVIQRAGLLYKCVFKVCSNSAEAPMLNVYPRLT